MHGVDVLQDVTLAGRGVGAVAAGKVLDLVVDVEQMLPISCNILRNGAKFFNSERVKMAVFCMSQSQNP